MGKIKLVCIGAGYFAQYQVEAWQRLPEIDLVAICDQTEEKAKKLAEKFGVPRTYSSVLTLFEKENPDVVDIITPPNTHYELCLEAARRGIHIICQKPLAPTFEEAEKIVRITEQYPIRLMVHENFRFQPWYRKIKELLENNAIGEKIFQLYFQMRTGDGWPVDAYSNRQPYFRTMPRLLIYETGIHFIDVFRYLLGEVKEVYAKLNRLNPHIVGEDRAFVFFEFANSAQAILDANRYNEPNEGNPRYTFGELLLEGEKGSIRLYKDGRITLQTLGQPEEEVMYHHEEKNFASDCVFTTQKHFMDRFLDEQAFETNGKDYLNNLRVQEAIYESSQLKEPIRLTPPPTF